MKFSLVPHLLELSREAKVAICSALFFAFCLGGWAVLKPPLGDCQKTVEPESTRQKASLQPASRGLKFIRWEQLQINKMFRKRLVTETLARAKPVLPTEPVKPESNSSVPDQAIRPETSARQIVSRGERTGTVIRGAASWYGGGDGMDGSPTASGEVFDASELTAAHRDLPFGTRLKVTCLNTGKNVIVRVNDRGPFNYNLILDLSREAAEQIGLISCGVGQVEIEILD